MVLALSIMLICAFAAIAPETNPVHAQEFSFEMEESESPPKGVKQMAQEIMEEEAQAAEQEAAESQQQAASSTSQGTGGGTSVGKEPAKYHGIFKALKPLDPVFPIKSGNIKASFINLANNTGNPLSFLSRENFSGGYFFESNEQDLGALKKLSGKIQYNRQLRNTLSVNSMSELGATLLKTDFKYNRKVSRTGSVGTQSLSDARKTSASYTRDNGFELSFNIDQNITRAISVSPSKTNNKKQTWKLVAPLGFRDGAKFTFTHANTTNRNNTGGPITKVIQSDARLDIPLNKKFDLNLGYQFLGNRSQPLAAQAAENRKKTSTVGLTYKYDEVTKFTYLYNFSRNRNYSSTSTNFNTVNRETNFERAFSKALLLKLGYQSTYDQAAGMTTVRTGNFSYDHKSFKALPGQTSIDARRQLTRTATAANTNYTLSMRTPLTYLKGKLRTNIQNVVTSQNDLVSFQRNTSVNQTISTDYLVTKKLSVGHSFNRTKNGTSTPTTATARSLSRVRTDKLSYKFGESLYFSKAINSMRYVYSVSRNANRTEIPTPGLTLNRVRDHAIEFGLKGADWTGNYSFGRSLSYLYGADTQRALKHKLALALNDFFGCKLSVNYTGAFQKTGRQTSSIVKLTKQITEKRSYYVDWEILDNKSRTTGTTETQSRFLEIGVDLVF